MKDDKWLRFNDDWYLAFGSKQGLLETAKGNGLAFFNHEAKFGVLVAYKPDNIKCPRFWWKPTWQQANLELITEPVELKDSESFSYEYQFEYLDKPVL